MQVLPFVVITIILTACLGYVITSMERTQVMNNWKSRRCELPVMIAAAYFKPAADPRSKSTFARDNFSFCMGELVHKVTEIAMAPVADVFGQQAKGAGVMGNILGDIRKLVHVIYEQFMAYLNTFFTRYSQTVYQFSRIIQYLRSVFRRVNAMAVGLIYTGLTIIRGIMNTIDFVMFVIMVILGIMVALIIILFFVLFPFIPLIMGVISALLVVAVGSSIGTLGHYQSAFCFAKGTRVSVKRADGIAHVPIEEVKLGDRLADDGGVTSCMKMSGKGVQMYSLCGIFVAGSHVVKGVNGEWTTVDKDIRARKCNTDMDYVYCLNTTTHMIHVIDVLDNYIIFRDWEEYDGNDMKGHAGWNYCVFSRLNKSAHYNDWKHSLTASSVDVLLGKGTSVYIDETATVPIESIKIGQEIWDGYTNTYTKVLGVVSGYLPKGCSEAGIIEWDRELKIWRRTYNGIRLAAAPTRDVSIGYMIITDTGSFTTSGVNVSERYRHIRDFTEVGHKNIEETYDFTVGCINSGRYKNGVAIQRT